MPTLVVAALSARLLAQSARRAGWKVIALDVFGDIDTRAAAWNWLSIGDAAELRIDKPRFLAALEAARSETDCLGWIAGTGFEPHPDLLEAGAAVLPLLGNPRATVDRVRDPGVFFPSLARLDVPHPETRLTPPDDPAGWLTKDFSTSGGWQIHRARTKSQRTGARAYFQREVPGRSMSVLFLASDTRAQTIAINELLVRAHGALPYVYHGAIGPVVGLPVGVTTALSLAVTRVVREFGLRGLGSLDFMLDGERLHVLEVNARPPATLGLYDFLARSSLLQAHVDACTGSLRDVPLHLDAAQTRGEAIVFAREAVEVTHAHTQRLLAFPCHDVPQAGSRVAAGAPLCSVTALGTNLDDVRQQLVQHEASVLALVQNQNAAH